MMSFCPALARTGQAELQGDLDALGRGRGTLLERLNRSALLLMEAGWVADSLSLWGDSLAVHGLRRLEMGIGELEGGQWQDFLSVDARVNGPSELLRDCEAWLEAMDQRGYPFAQVWLDEAGAYGDSLELRAVFVPGPRGPLGQVRVLGLQRLAEKFVIDFMALPERGDFSRSRADRALERLAASGWFSSLEEPRLAWDPSEKQVAAVFDLRERRRSNRITAALGGGSGSTSGAFDLDLFSPFGGGRHWRLGGDWQGGERSLLDVKLSEPRLLGRNIALDLGFHRVKQDSTWLRQSVQADLRLLMPGGLEGVAGYGFERSLFLSSESEVSKRRHRFGLSWRSLNPEHPGEQYLSVITDLLIKRSQRQGDIPRQKQFESAVDWHWTLRPGGPWKLRQRGGGRMLLPDEGGFNLAELFGLGGAATLRGFDEEQFRGDRVLWSGVELALGDPLELSLFLDYGWGRWLREQDVEIDFKGWGAGLGLKAPAPGGALALWLAVGDSKRLEDVRVHVVLDTGF